MKRVDALRSLLGGYKGYIEDVKIRLNDSGYAYNANEMIKLYNYLDEDLPEHRDDLCEPKAEQQEPKEEQQKPKKRKPRVEIDLGKVRALHDAGWSYEKIALDEIGCSVATIMKRLKEEAEG